MSTSTLARQLGLYQLPCTLLAARNFLDDLLDSTRLLPLYQLFFPAEFAASTADQRRAPDAPYSAAEWEFFQLVNTQLFPVDLDWLECVEERILFSPLVGLGFDWDELTPTEFRPGWQMLLVLAGECALTDTDLENTPFGAVLTRLTRPAALQVTNWPPFVRLCQAAPPPLAYTPLALAMIWHETGNLWLDTDPDRGDGVTWTVRGIRTLAAEYTDARSWRDRTDTLLTWLEEAPAHLEEVITLWNRSLQATAA